MAQTGEYTRKCKKVGQIAVIEVGRGRVLTTRAMEVPSSEGSSKRRKLVSNADYQLVSHLYDVNSLENSVSPATSYASDRFPVSPCSRNESSEFRRNELRSVDLKVESYPEGCETEISTLINCIFSRETTPSTKLCADIDKLESSTTRKPSRVRHTAANMPPPVEIEEFFSAAEKCEQKRFADKYNYDVVKDEPLKGRYQWVRLKP